LSRADACALWGCGAIDGWNFFHLFTAGSLNERRPPGWLTTGWLSANNNGNSNSNNNYNNAHTEGLAKEKNLKLLKNDAGRYESRHGGGDS
jgi:hypothetical protein